MITALAIGPFSFALCLVSGKIQAVGKKTKTSFKKGQSGNPTGRPSIPSEIKAARAVNQIEIEKMLNHVAFMPKGQLSDLVKDQEAPAILVGFAKIMEKMVKYGDLWAASFVLDRMIGRPNNAPPIDVTPPPTQVIIQSGIAQPKSFVDFCVAGKYPTPFPKQEEMRIFAFQNKDPRLLLGSRGYGKTDYLTILGVAYEIYLNWFHWKHSGHALDESNLIITKSRLRNTAMIEEIANALESNEVPMDKRNASVIRVEGLIGKDASVEAITIKTSMRGRHPKRVLMDDPVTEEDVSDAMRQLVQRKYNEVLKLCSNVLVIGQPAHKHDLYAKLRGIVLKLEVPFGSIPELDHDLEAQRLAGVDENSILMSYYLKIPDDGTTPFDKIKRIDQFPLHGSAVAFIDPSHEGGDYTALSIIKQYGEGIAVVGFTWKKAWNHCLEDMKPHLIKFGVAKLAFETNSLGDQPIIMLRHLLDNTGIGVIGRRSNNNKHSRIMAAGSFAHIIHLSKESDKIYTDQVIEYEYNAKHDDAPDSLATGLEWIGLIKGKA